VTDSAILSQLRRKPTPPRVTWEAFSLQSQKRPDREWAGAFRCRSRYWLVD
jgi:hypothetical protein